MIVEINKLQINKYHEKIYQTNEIDELKQSIKEVGLLEKIVVNNNTDLTIISGYRRYLALKELGYKTVDVKIINVNPDDELLTLISFNKQRVKTLREKLNESDYLKSIWGQKRGRKSANDKVIPLNINEPVDTRKKIADELKLSTGQLSKAEFIDEKAPELIEEIDKGNFSVNQIYDGLRTKEKKEKSKSDQSVTPTIIDNEYYKIINKSSDLKF